MEEMVKRSGGAGSEEVVVEQEEYVYLTSLGRHGRSRDMCSTR